MCLPGLVIVHLAAILTKKWRILLPGIVFTLVFWQVAAPASREGCVTEVL